MRFFLITALAILTALPVQAASCYRAQEAEAEQGLRIHSELMVIGLNCQHMTPQGQQNFYAQYREFTQRHADLFGTYEEVLMRYYAKNGSAAPEQDMNALRTAFANKISHDAAQLRPDVFCARYAMRIPKADQMSREQLRQWASIVFPQSPPSQPFCEDIAAQ